MLSRSKFELYFLLPFSLKLLAMNNDSTMRKKSAYIYIYIYIYMLPKGGGGTESPEITEPWMLPELEWKAGGA